MKWFWRAVCNVRGHDWQRMPSLHTAVCQRCGGEHPDAFWMNKLPERIAPAEFLASISPQEQITPPPEPITPVRETKYSYSVYLSDGTIIAQDKWDVLVAEGRVTMLPSGQLVIAGEGGRPGR